MMSYMLDKDGVPRVTAGRTDLQKRLEAAQHLLRILSKTRLDDFLGGTALRLDLEKVRTLLERYRSDLDLRLPVPKEYASVARYHELAELTIYADTGKFAQFCLFLFDRFEVFRGSLADFLTHSPGHNFSSHGSSPSVRLAIRRALSNFALVMLVVFGISCTGAVQEVRDFLVQDHLLNGVQDCYVFFVINMAIAEVMRMFREGTKETHGELIGEKRFCEELKRALGEAILKIPSPHVSSVVIRLFDRVTYGLIRWQGKPRADATVKGTPTKALTPREEKRAEKQRTWRENKRAQGTTLVK